MSPWRPDSQCGSGVRAVISECQLCQLCSSHRPLLGSETTGLAPGVGGGWGSTPKPGPRCCVFVSPSGSSIPPAFPPNQSSTQPPGGRLLKHQLNPDLAFLKNFPWLLIPSRPRVKFLLAAFKAFIHSFLHSLTHSCNKSGLAHLLCARETARYTRAVEPARSLPS